MVDNPCFLDMDPGLCAVPQQRFFYNATEENCTEFMYHGCYGNENNFRSKSTCEMKCKIVGSCSTGLLLSNECCMEQAPELV